MLDSHQIMGYVYDGYWADIGTIRRFYEVNLEMTYGRRPYDLFSPKRPIYTRPRFLPASEVHGARMTQALIADGCRIADADIYDAVIGQRSIIDAGATADSVPSTVVRVAADGAVEVLRRGAISAARLREILERP